MAIIDCPECAKPISDQCLACPVCGVPMQAEALASAIANSKPTTIEATSKRHKGVQAVGAALLVLGFVSAVISNNASGGISIPFVLIATGLAIFFAGRVGAWWGNG